MAPLRKERRATWAAIPRHDRPDWTTFNNRRLWESQPDVILKEGNFNLSLPMRKATEQDILSYGGKEA